MFLKKQSKGQTLIEVLAAFSVAIVLVAAIASAVLFALYNVQYGKSQNVATQYAQEGMEIIRKLQDSGETFNENATYCLPKDTFPKDKQELATKAADLDRCAPNIANSDSMFVREISTVMSEPNCSGYTKVTSSVLWSDSKCAGTDLYCHKASLESCLSGFNRVATPGVNPVQVPEPPILRSAVLSQPGWVVTLTYDLSDGATSYQAYACNGYSCTPNLPVNNPEYNVSGCDDRIYGVKAVNTAGQSALSNTIGVNIYRDCGGGGGD